MKLRFKGQNSIKVRSNGLGFGKIKGRMQVSRNQKLKYTSAKFLKNNGIKLKKLNLSHQNFKSSNSSKNNSSGIKLKKLNISHQKWQQDWITKEAEDIIARSYRKHKEFGDNSVKAPPLLTTEELESLTAETDVHYKPKDLSDKIAYGMVNALTPLTHWFFKDNHMHHAVVLETVASIPGMVGGFVRHFRSLRKMKRDHGWSVNLVNEAWNEKQHLLVWMRMIQPSVFDRFLVMGAQVVYGFAYSTMYALHPRMAHRFTGYLEQAAVAAYTEFLKDIDSGKIENVAAPDIAKRYWQLEDDAKLRDVVLHVRGDECFHRNMNHYLSEMIGMGEQDILPSYPFNDPHLPKAYAEEIHEMQTIIQKEKDQLQKEVDELKQQKEELEKEKI